MAPRHPRRNTAAATNCSEVERERERERERNLPTTDERQHVATAVRRRCYRAIRAPSHTHRHTHTDTDRQTHWWINDARHEPHIRHVNSHCRLSSFSEHHPLPPFLLRLELAATMTTNHLSGDALSLQQVHCMVNPRRSFDSHDTRPLAHSIIV